jgi:hypothetical protein
MIVVLVCQMFIVMPATQVMMLFPSLNLEDRSILFSPGTVPTRNDLKF